MSREKTKAQQEYGRIWTSSLKEAAMAEGWILSDCRGSIYSDWQIQRIDNPQENVLPDGRVPPELEDDEDAMRIVFEGQGEHHAVARAFLEKYAPREFATVSEVGELKRAEMRARVAHD